VKTPELNVFSVRTSRKRGMLWVTPDTNQTIRYTGTVPVKIKVSNRKMPGQSSDAEPERPEGAAAASRVAPALIQLFGLVKFKYTLLCDTINKESFHIYKFPTLIQPQRLQPELRK